MANKGPFSGNWTTFDAYIKPYHDEDIWATTCDFQQCGILTSVDSDEPVQPPVKFVNSK